MFCETVSVAKNKHLKLVGLCIKTIILLQYVSESLIINVQRIYPTKLNFVQLYSDCDGLEMAFDRLLLLSFG